MKFRFEPKNFFLGLGAMFVGLLLPGISNIFIDLVTKVRDMLPWSKKK